MFLKIIDTWKKIKKMLSPSLGDYGERVACRFLEKQGYLILDKNWRCDIGEIDIVALRKRILIFVEVKTRSADIAEFFSPEEAVDSKKQHKLRTLALFYERENRRHLTSARVMADRFDIITVTARKRPLTLLRKEILCHIEDAF